jgi:DNA polymerase III epsilon subunit-like protein
MQLLGLSAKLYGASGGVVRRPVVVAGPFSGPSSGPSSGSTLPPSQSRIRVNHRHQQEAIAVIDRLRQGIEYERNAGCVDVQGNRQRFSAFLGDSLDSLTRFTKTELASAQDTIELQDIVTKLARLRALADQYQWMTKRERGAVLAEVMESMCRVCTESPPCPPPLPTAWKVSHETWTQQQQQQQQQQEQQQCPYAEPHQPKRWVPIAFDLETTGLSRIHSFPVEIAASAPLTGERFHRLVRLQDGVSMSPSAERATGLKTERFRDPSLPTFEQAYAQFLEFIETNVAAAGFEAMPVLVGHNIADFDIPLLLNRAKACDLPAPRGARILDTMRTARQILRNYKKEDRPQGMSLSVLYTHLTGRPAQGAHRAAADVDMTVEVLMALIHHARHGPDFKGAIDMTLLHPFFSKPHLPSAFDEG